MPAAAEKQIKRQGGTARYRTLKKGGKTMTCAVTRKTGPKGGKTVCWNKKHESLGVPPLPPILEMDPIRQQDVPPARPAMATRSARPVQPGRREIDRAAGGAGQEAWNACRDYLTAVARQNGWSVPPQELDVFVSDGFRTMDRDVAGSLRQNRQESAARVVVLNLLETDRDYGYSQHRELSRALDTARHACIMYLQAKGRQQGHDTDFRSHIHNGLEIMVDKLRDWAAKKEYRPGNAERPRQNRDRIQIQRPT